MLRGAVILLALAVGACDSDPNLIFAGLTLASRTSPLPGDCNGAPQTGVNYRGSKVKPYLEADPTTPSHLVLDQRPFARGSEEAQ
jgi:hypothetical protein